MSHLITGILFDLDGTLSDTSNDFIKIIQKMQTEDGMTLSSTTTIKKHISEGVTQLIKITYPNQVNNLEKIVKLRDRFLAGYEKIIKKKSESKLFFGIDALLNSIENQGIKWGVVTNKPYNYAHILLQHLKLEKRCHTLVCPEHVKNSKPSPEPLLLACKQIQCEPKNCLYIGDHKRDIIAGQKAKIFSVAAHYGYIPPEENPDHWHADYNVKEPIDLLYWLKKNQWQLPNY